MASLRRRTHSNSLLYRVRDSEGRERQRSVDIGPTETLADGAKFYQALIDGANREIEAAGRRPWIVRAAERSRDKAAQKLIIIERAIAEVAGDA